MGLESLLKKVAATARKTVFVPDTREEIKQYLMAKNSSTFAKLPEPQKEKLEERMDHIVDRTFTKYEKNMNSLSARIGGSLGALIAGDQALAAALAVPPYYAIMPSYLAMVGKTALETRQVYSYLKNTLDLNGLYGIAKYGLLKAIGLAIPFIGPAIEGPSIKRLFSDRIAYEANKEFRQYTGEHVPMYKKIASWVGNYVGKIKDRIKGNIEGLPEPAPVYAR